jgi:hypothetical protein
MPLGQNKLIQKTSNKINNTNKKNITRNTNIKNKNTLSGQPSKDPAAVTYETQKMTFYIKSDLMKRLRNFAYWERQSLTNAFNSVLQDGLKSKNTKNKP